MLWKIEYEECGLDELWVYKLDHEPVADGGWHRLNQRTRACYRIHDGLFCLVGADDRISAEEYADCLTAFAAAAPLGRGGTMEIDVYREPRGHEMDFHELYGCPSVTFAALTPSLLRESFRRLLDAAQPLPQEGFDSAQDD